MKNFEIKCPKTSINGTFIIAQMNFCPIRVIHVISKTIPKRNALIRATFINKCGIRKFWIFLGCKKIVNKCIKISWLLTFLALNHECGVLFIKKLYFLLSIEEISKSKISSSKSLNPWWGGLIKSTHINNTVIIPIFIKKNFFRFTSNISVIPQTLWKPYQKILPPKYL